MVSTKTGVVAMAYAIARVAKIKSLGSLSGLSRHHMRTAPTPNANPKAPETVRVLVGSGNPYKDVKALLPEKRRVNAVLAMEHLLTASPEYFRPDNPGAAGTYDQARMDAWAKSAIEFLKARYGQNLASAVLHLDEATPHIQAMVVPLREDGKLDANTLFGPKALVSLQDDYHAATSHLGLQRGIEGSKAKHERIKTFYGRVNAEGPELPKVETPKPKDMREPTLAERVPFSDAKTAYEAEAAKRLAKAEQRKRELAALSEAKLKAYPTIAAKAAMADGREKAAKARDAALTKLRDSALILREIPLPEIFNRLGCQRDPSDKKNWKTPAGRISTDGQRFYNHDLGMGGGGAIDLVMHQLKCDYKQALGWIGDQFGHNVASELHILQAKYTAEKVVSAAKAPSIIPEPSPQHIDVVRNYLLNERGLSPAVVDPLIEKGQIFATTWQRQNGGKILVNCGFRLHGTDNREGVELRGVSGDFHGVRGHKGFFLAGNNETAQKTVFVESAIEALSALQIFGNQSVKVVSTTGNPDQEFYRQFVGYEARKKRDIVLAFNNDTVGKNLSKQGSSEARSYGANVEIYIPKHGKDLNDEIRGEAERLKFAAKFGRDRKEPETPKTPTKSKGWEGPRGP